MSCAPKFRYTDSGHTDLMAMLEDYWFGGTDDEFEEFSIEFKRALADLDDEFPSGDGYTYKKTYRVMDDPDGINHMFPIEFIPVLEYDNKAYQCVIVDGEKVYKFIQRMPDIEDFPSR